MHLQTFNQPENDEFVIFKYRKKFKGYIILNPLLGMKNSK
jgi:hypothetical protein